MQSGIGGIWSYRRLCPSVFLFGFRASPTFCSHYLLLVYKHLIGMLCPSSPPTFPVCTSRLRRPAQRIELLLVLERKHYNDRIWRPWQWWEIWYAGIIVGHEQKKRNTRWRFYFLKIGILGVHDASKTIPHIRLYYLHQKLKCSSLVLACINPSANLFNFQAQTGLHNNLDKI